MSDKDLIERFQSGDTSALGVLYEKYKEDVTAYLYALNANHHAEDLLQEVFIHIMKYPFSYNEDFEVKQWFIWIAKQRLIVKYHYDNALRRKGTVNWMDGDEDYLQIACPSPDPEQELITKMGMERAVKKINKLSDIRAEALRLRCFDQYEYEEISEILNLPLGTVKSRIYRARQAL